jgi:CubicO group peptidase (beta-lactamase class C family)
MLAKGIAILLAGLSCIATPQEATAEALLRDLVSVLNTKDETKIKEFVDKRTVLTGAVTAEQRIARLVNLAQIGAPFTVTKVEARSASELRASVKDKNGGIIGFAMLHDGAAEPKMTGLRVADPETLDAPPAKDYTGWKDLATLNESIRSDTDCPAMTIAVLRNGRLEVVASGKRRVGGDKDVDRNDVWKTGSIGKPICSTVIAKLIEMGRLHWDTTLGEALKDLPMRDEYKSVTLEQIMRHRGGIPQDMNFTALQVAAITGTATKPMDVRINYAKNILGREPIAKKFAYSNAGYALLAIIAERTVNKPYEQLVREILFKPLGLNQSFVGSNGLSSDRPSGHVRTNGRNDPHELGGALETMLPGAGGGVWMSPSDLVHFGEMHMRGLQGKDGYLKSATIARLHNGIAESDGAPMKYACGWGIETFPGIESMHTHNGSDGTFFAQLAVFPKANVVVVSFVNRGGEGNPSPPMQAVLAIARKYAKS